MARLRILGAVVCAALVVPHLASAQAFRVGDNANFGGTPQILYPDVAYDPVNKRYFEVTTASSHTAIEGRIIIPTAPSSNSFTLGSTVTISSPSFLNEYPRVTYSPHVGTGGGFLVTWHKGFASGNKLFAKVMGRLYAANGDPLTSEFVVSTATTDSGGTASFYGMAANSAYATGSREFLVVWVSTSFEVLGQRISPTGEAKGGNFVVSEGGSRRYDQDGSVAYNPVTDKFYVAWAVFDDGSNGGFASGRLITAGSGAKGSVRDFDSAKGVKMTAVAYNPAANQFLVGWYHDDGIGRQYTSGVLLNADGAVIPNGSNDIRVLSALYGAYNALDIEFNIPSGEYFLITHGNDSLSNGKEDFGVSIRGNGVPHDNGFRVTVTNASGGNYNPRLAASADRKEWLVVTSTNFLQVSGQFIGSNSTGGGVIDPPTPCTYSIVSPTSSPSVAPVKGSGTITLTTSAPTCAWTATTNVNWITLSKTSGTGSATITYTYPTNHLQKGRTATITVGGKTLVVSQKGHVRQILDFNLDGKLDFLIHHRTEGWVGTWKMDGLTLLDGQYLIPNRVPDVNWQIVGSADFNGDDWSDILWQHTSGRLAVWEMSGVLLVNVVELPKLPGDWKARSVADMNGDTQPDIVIQNTNTGDVGVWFMNGLTVTDGRLFSHSVADRNWKIVATDDFDGDGDIDLIWQHDDNFLAIWFMDGTTRTGVEFLNPRSMPNARWKIRGAGDVDGDGKADLIVQEEGSNDIGVWMMNGAERLGAKLLSPSSIQPGWIISGPR